MEFAFIEDDDELRGPSRTPISPPGVSFCIPNNAATPRRDFNGAFRLTGGAGTGKTVVLLHRARELQRRNPAARVVLTTFNRTLAEALTEQLKILDSVDHVGGRSGSSREFTWPVSIRSPAGPSSARPVWEAATVRPDL